MPRGISDGSIAIASSPFSYTGKTDVSSLDQLKSRRPAERTPLIHSPLQNRSRHGVWPERRTDMKFLQRLLGKFCSHRFTWPRLSGNGQHYQICLICGTAYQYDWKRMQRTDRLLVTNGQHALASARTRLPGTVN